MQWDLSGAEVGQWRSPRINDLAVCAGGARLVSICAEKKIRLCTIAEGARAPPWALHPPLRLLLSHPSRRTRLPGAWRAG